MNDSQIRRKIVSEYLEETGKTQKELAQMSDLHPNTVSRFLQEKGTTSLNTAVKIFFAIAKELSIDTYWEYALTDDLLRFAAASPKLNLRGSE